MTYPNSISFLKDSVPLVRELKGSEYWKYKLVFRHERALRRVESFLRIESSFIKGGKRVRLTEALTMDFISRNTTIHIPKLLDIFSIKGDVYIVQQYINAPVLEDVWRRLSIVEKRSSVLQLKNCLDQLRALKPPDSDRVQAIDGSGFIDERLGTGELGPFDDHDAFHRFLGYHALRDCPDRFPLAKEAISKVANRKYRTVFSHGDLGPHNILWKDGQIVLIDWERSGWFPEYWDYTRAYAARGYTIPEWWEMFKDVVDRYDDELDVDIQMLNYVERL